MTSDRLDLNKLGQLAHIAISEDQQNTLQKELSDIVTLLDTLKEVNTENIQPLSHPLEQTQPLRADTPNPNIDRELLQQSAPKQQDGLYLVPQFVEEN
jgi:aspartyl-tRNA(Asn)/glutamyl-tRNA(Gln) amidotransferase subunit C